MSKLHMYRSGDPNKVADGDGNLRTDADFDVKITWGSVIKGNTYVIKEGTSGDGSSYHCKAGAGTGDTAKFGRAPYEFTALSQEYLGTTRALRAALEASQKTVTILIAKDDLTTLKGGNYKLCFAKKVGDNAYNVVWQSYTDYLYQNKFLWTPQYQLFGTNQFQAGVTVHVSTNVVDIGLGEKSTLDKDGNLGKASTGGPDTAITMDNKYGSIHPGLNQLSTGLKGEQVSTPIYVAPKVSVQGTVELTPVEKVLVWFQQNIETSTMFSDARSNSIEIDLTSSNNETRLYSNQKWSNPGP